MDIEQLKDKWKTIPDQGLQALNETTLRRITDRRYNSLLFQIALPEMFIAAGYLFLAVFLVAFFYTFQASWLKVSAIFAILLLIAIPVLRFIAYFRYYKSVRPTQPVHDTLAVIRKNGQRFMKTQYVLAVLNQLLLADLVFLIPLVYSEDLSMQQLIITIAVLSLIILFLSILIWRYHRKRIRRISEFAQRII